MKVKIVIESSIRVGSMHDEIELDDDMTEEDIAEAVSDYVANYISWGHEVVKENT